MGIYSGYHTSQGDFDPEEPDEHWTVEDEIEAGIKPCEEWRAIPNYQGYYEISDSGRVRSWYTGGGHKLSIPKEKTLHVDKDGYLSVRLYRNGKGQWLRVSRLVLFAFLGTSGQGMEASHLNGNNKNNHLSNLEWETRLENEQREAELFY